MSDTSIRNGLRTISIERDQSIHAEGSALVTVGNTKVLCLATVENRVPSFLRDSGKGWVTAEYSMLPRSTNERMRRERKGAGGRTMEIQRLIGRSLRAVVDFHLLGERSITVDCDVLQADGGTRCASITGAYVAMSEALNSLVNKEIIARNPVIDQVAAISVGIVGGELTLDLDYAQDSTADVDMNVVMTGSGKLVEVQGTAEETAFSRAELNGLLDLAETGLTDIFEIQRLSLE